MFVDTPKRGFRPPGTTESLLPSRQLTLLGGSLHLGVEGEEEESVRGVELRNSVPLLGGCSVLAVYNETLRGALKQDTKVSSSIHFICVGAEGYFI